MYKLYHFEIVFVDIVQKKFKIVPSAHVQYKLYQVTESPYKMYLLRQGDTRSLQLVQFVQIEICTMTLYDC